MVDVQQEEYDMKYSSIRNAALAFFAAVSAALACGAGEVKVEKLERGIWRVRMERGGKWPESGLNR